MHKPLVKVKMKSSWQEITKCIDNEINVEEGIKKRWLDHIMLCKFPTMTYYIDSIFVPGVVWVDEIMLIKIRRNDRKNKGVRINGEYRNKSYIIEINELIINEQFVKNIIEKLELISL